MYNEYFGLADTPFRLTPDPRFFYPGGGRGEVLDALIYAITSGEGIIKVVGEVGTGKTMLCRMLEERLPDAVEIVYLANPSLTPEDILQAIALELGLQMDISASRIQIMHGLQQALLDRHADNRRVVALVEEAQSMPLDTLEEIRLLSNLETKSEKLLQIVLFGQPELDENLAVPQIRQLRERITHGFKLKALSADEIRSYMEHRLRASGYRGREAFSSKAYKVMFKASEGLTRRVNILADKSLLAAYAEDTHDVSERHVKVAVQDTQLSVPQHSAVGSRWKNAGGLLLAVAIGWLAAAWYMGLNEHIGSGQMISQVDNRRSTAASSPVPTPLRSETILPAPAPAPVISQKAESQAIGNPQPALTSQSGGADKVLAVPDVSGDAAKPVEPVHLAAGDAPAISSRQNQLAVEQPVMTAKIDAAMSGSVVRQNSVAAGDTPKAQSERVKSAPQGVDASRVDAPARARKGASRVQSPNQVEKNSKVSAMATSLAVDGDSTLEQGRAVTAVALNPAADNAQAQLTRKTPAPAKAIRTALRTGTAKTRAHDQTHDQTRGVLQKRLELTHSWLKRVNPDHYSIQVLATDAAQRANLVGFLKRRARNGLLENIYVYETVISKRPWYGVLFGEYDKYSDAKEALRELPRSMTRQQPFIRNISDITAKM